MSFAAPAGLLLLALAVPVVLLHVLRPRRSPVTVSSTWLWRELSRPVTAASPWQRLRPSLLLLLQLLAVALLALAVARPVRTTEAPLSPHTVFVLDASGSMAAKDGSPERLDAAKRAAERLRAELPSGGVASIVVADANPRVVLSASADRRAFSSALRPIRAMAAPADIATAFTLAASLETPGLPLGIVLLSDGVLPDEATRALVPGTRFVPVGTRATNRAITRLLVTPDGAGLRALVVMRNTGGPATTETLRLDVDGSTRATVRVRLDRGATVEREVSLPDGDRIEAFLDTDDLVDADSHAYAVASRRPAVRVLLVGPDNPFLDRLLAALPGVTVERSPVARPTTGFDLAVYDRVAVPAGIDVPFLAIAPPVGVGDVKVTGQLESPAIALVDTGDALLRDVDLSTVVVASAQRLETASAQVLVASENGPLLVRGRHGDEPFLYLAFALHESDLPLQVAFPVIGDRAVSELTGAEVPPPDVRVGQSLAMGDGATLRRPGGATETFTTSGAALLTRAGFHTISQPGRPDRVIAVNADAAESAVAPNRSLPVPEPPAGDRRVPTRGERPLLVYVVALLLVVLAAEYVVSRRQVGVPRRQWRAGTAVRLAIVGALVLAVAGLTVPRPGTYVATMFLIDGSDSMGTAGRDAAVEWVREALDAQPDGARAGVAFFGGDARLELTVQRHASLVQPATTVDATRTNLAGALRLAAAVLPADARRRIVVVSDGRATEDDAAAEADRLRRDGIDVDVRPIERSSGRDAAVARLEAPDRASQGERVPLRATIVSTEDVIARVVLDRDGVVVEERAVDLRAGDNQVDFGVVVTEPGVARYRVRVDLPGDQIKENDAAYAAVEVDGPPRVLVVPGQAGEADALVAALRAGGLVVDTVDAAALPGVDRLAGYRSTVLVDVPATALSGAQVQALTTATRELGRGLVTIGGDSSYALGGYRDSELEALLPVMSDVTDPKRRSSVAEVIALDTSGSMGACHCAEGSNGLATGGNRSRGGVNKTDIAKSGAARAIAALSSSDQVGVLAFNDDQKMVVPLQTVPSDEEVRRKLATVHPDGRTDLVAGLRRAASELRAVKAKLKHVILFSDGFTAPENLDALAREAGELAAQGITVSVVATGEGAASELAKVAEAGRGRFYAGRDLSEIPEILVQEAVIASRNFVNEGTYFPTVVGASAAVQELTSAPALLGYLATTTKASASTALRIGEDEDPLLASWNAGLGRVTSWTSDASRRWAKQWASWDGYASFWSSVVRETFPATSGSVSLRARVDGALLRLSFESETPLAEGTSVSATVTDPRGVTSRVQLDRTSTSVHAAEVPANLAGTYAVGAVATSPAGEVARATALATQSYAAEYRPGSTDAAALRAVSQRSGGRGVIVSDAAFDAESLPARHGRVPLAGWLLVAAALAWPVDVALRRLTVNPVPLRAALARAPVPRLRRRRRAQVASPASPASPGSPGAPPSPAPAEPPAPPEPAPPPPPPPPPTSPSLERLLERKRRGGAAGDRDD